MCPAAAATLISYIPQKVKTAISLFTFPSQTWFQTTNHKSLKQNLPQYQLFEYHQYSRKSTKICDAQSALDPFPIIYNLLTVTPNFLKQTSRICASNRIVSKVILDEAPCRCNPIIPGTFSAN